MLNLKTQATGWVTLEQFSVVTALPRREGGSWANTHVFSSDSWTLLIFLDFKHSQLLERLLVYLGRVAVCSMMSMCE